MTVTDNGGSDGITFLVHIDPPYRHARHYFGWASSPAAAQDAIRRLTTGRSAVRLLKAAYDSGSKFRITRTWHSTTIMGVTRMRQQGNARKYCKECRAADRTAKQDNELLEVLRRSVELAGRRGRCSTRR